MEENQSKEVMTENIEPAENTDNSNEIVEKTSAKDKEGQSNDPSGLILGKFKNTEELSKAYSELQKLQGNQSAELGKLRENAASLNMINQAWQREQEVRCAEKDLKETVQKYNTYFQDPSFREIYKNAYLALGSNLDPDRFINLLEGYVNSRIFEYDRSKSAQAETQSKIDGMKFDKNEVISKTQTPVKKRVEEMNPKEYEEFLRGLI